MGNRNNPMCNGEGYFDPTAYVALENIEREEARLRKLMRVIFSACELAGFKLESRLILVDKKSGRIWK